MVIKTLMNHLVHNICNIKYYVFYNILQYNIRPTATT